MGWSTINPEELAYSVRSMRRSLPQTIKDLRNKIRRYENQGHVRAAKLYQQTLDFIEANPEKFR